MESGGDQVRIVYFFLDPSARVFYQASGGHRNPRRFNTDVGLNRAVPACPTPDITEHSLVQASEVEIIEQSLDRRLPGSDGGPQNVCLLGLIEFSSGGDVGELQASKIILTKECVAVADGEKPIDHSD